MKAQPKSADVPAPIACLDWNAILAECDRWLRTVVFSRLRDSHATDEVMQEVALAAVRQAAPLRDQDKAAPWLYRLAVRQVLLYRRKMGRQRKLAVRYETYAPNRSQATSDPLDWLLADERRGLIRVALQNLSARDMEILLLKYTEDWSYQQISQQLGVSLSAVEARLHRARRRLRRTGGTGSDRDSKMKQFNDFIEDDTRFDRLVDGELTVAERRQLLESLDDEPGGWRRCAMAFLEAQAWRQEMGDSSAERDLADRDGVAVELGRRQKSTLALASKTNEGGNTNDQAPSGVRTGRPGLIRLALAMAACFLVAFLMGSELRRRWDAGSKLHVPLTQNKALNAVEQPRGETPPTPATPTPVTQSPSNDLRPWGEATIVMGDDDQHEVEVPVFDLDPYARQVLLETSSTAFNNLRDELRRDGFDVHQKSKWSTVEVGGGKQMYVPVGDFEISPIAHRVIQ